MKTEHVRYIYTTYHGTSHDMSYTKYVYSGKEDYNELYKLFHIGYPVLLNHYNDLMALVIDANNKRDAELEVQQAEYDKRSKLYRAFHARPTHPYYEEVDGKRELDTLKESISKVGVLQQLLIDTEDFRSLFCFEDKKNKTIELLLECAQK